MILLNDISEWNVKKRYLFKIYGIVQGVGFRPYVYKKAKEFEITGWVNNAGGSVVIDCSGSRQNIKSFVLSIIKKPPTLARIEKVVCFPLEEIIHNDFVIEESVGDSGKIKFISPDIAVCDKCMEDIMNKDNRRFEYAFTNCTECGPRYSIIKSLPYDRKSTTMDCFDMCPDCSEEYHNPSSRRFHAQPNCCKKCGPSLELLNNRKEAVCCGGPIKKTRELLKQGYIIAIKGIGGFHLVCHGKSHDAIAGLRLRKDRQDKPLAVMVKDLETAREFCNISDMEERLLTGNKRPIVLLQKKASCILPESIAPNQKRLGIMLPYTPLHHMLFQEDIKVLIMTSGNISGAPIQYINNEAYKHLNKIADYFLIHNREIHIPIDDPVVKVVNDKECVIRMGRGYAPYVHNAGMKDEILALGPEQKSTFSACRDGYVYMSQYLGDLKDYDSFSNYKYVLRHFMDLLELKPQTVVHDLHTSYVTTCYANELQGRTIAVQHHHAHMASCMAEHNLWGQVIGVIYDGTGMGTDRAIWGGEFFTGTRSSFNRIGHLRYVDIQGGDKSIEEPWRCATSYLYSSGYKIDDFLNGIAKEKIDVIKQALDSRLNCYKSSSMGRFFDCIAALTGIRHIITYDGQAAIELENIMDDSVKECYQYQINLTKGIFEIGYKDIIDRVLEDLKSRVYPSVISAKFHNTVLNFTIDMVCRIKELYGYNKVVLSGGVFENQYLLKSIHKGLEEKGFDVFHNMKIPINDGGVSFGQLAIADTLIEEGKG